MSKSLNIVVPSVTLGCRSDILSVLSFVGMVTIDETLPSTNGQFDGTGCTGIILDLGNGASFEIINATGLIYSPVGRSNVSLSFINCTVLPACVAGVISYTASGSTTTPTLTVLDPPSPAIDISGIEAHPITSIDLSAVVTAPAVLSWNFGNQGLLAQEQTDILHKVRILMAGVLDQVTLNLFSAFGEPPLRPIADITIDAGGESYATGQAVFVDGIEVGSVICNDSVTGIITGISLNPGPNAFSDTSGTVTVVSGSGFGATLHVSSLGTNTDAADITNAGGIVTTN